MALIICFYSVDPPDGPLVATAREGIGAVHLVGDDGPLCGASTEKMAVGALREPVDWEHSDLCTRCQQIQESQ